MRIISLTHSFPLHFFSASFLMFLGGREKVHWEQLVKDKKFKEIFSKGKNTFLLRVVHGDITKQFYMDVVCKPNYPDIIIRPYFCSLMEECYGQSKNGQGWRDLQKFCFVNWGRGISESL